MRKLWTPPTGVGLLRMRKQEKLVVLPDGTRAKVTLDDSGTVRQTETDERMDALVMPKPVVIKIHRS